MFGSSANGISAGGTVRGAVNAPVLAGGNTAARNAQLSDSGSTPGLALTPWLLIVLAAMYLIWAGIEQHERIRESLEPSNIAFNLRNLALIGITAILGIVILKIAFTKLVAWGVPGAATVNQIVAAS